MENSNDGRFKPGHKTWNKGKHIKVNPNCIPTQFKKGHTRNTWTRPIGGLQIKNTKSGRRRFIKIAEKPSQWKMYSQWLWEKENGPIPETLVIHHVDGNSLNDCIENYQLVTRIEHMALHREYILARMKQSTYRQPKCSLCHRFISKIRKHDCPSGTGRSQKKTYQE